jgi:hypothetical protein
VPANSEILIYTSPDGNTRIDVHIDGETVWLSQAQMADLFQTTKQNVSLHIRNIFEDQELQELSVVKESLDNCSRWEAVLYQILQFGCDHFDRLQSKVSSRNPIPPCGPPSDYASTS